MNNTEEKLTVNTEETLQKSIIDHENDAIATGNNEEKQKDKKKFTIKKKAGHNMCVYSRIRCNNFSLYSFFASFQICKRTGLDFGKLL